MAKVESSAEKPLYTCPMHPKVQQDYPGNCSKCGMTLELRTVAEGSDNQDSAELRGIAKAIRLSRATMGNIRQNLFFAFLYNALGIPLVAGILFPFFGLLLSPMIAGAAMSMSSLSVIGNALRLRRMKL